jgi:hypothetical protein
MLMMAMALDDDAVENDRLIVRRLSLSVSPEKYPQLLALSRLCTRLEWNGFIYLTNWLHNPSKEIQWRTFNF